MVIARGMRLRMKRTLMRGKASDPSAVRQASAAASRSIDIPASRAPCRRQPWTRRACAVPATFVADNERLGAKVERNTGDTPKASARTREQATIAAPGPTANAYV